MSNFDLAIPLILKHEGGFVDDPNDNGGATNFGISLRFLQSIDKDASIATIKNMTREQAIYLYRTEFWDKGNYGAIDNQDIANKAFDIAVNIGVGRANKLLQAAINECGENVEIDGIIGKITFGVINNEVRSETLLRFLKLRLIEYYVAIVKQDDSQKKFLLGWLIRALS